VYIVAFYVPTRSFHEKSIYRLDRVKKTIFDAKFFSQMYKHIVD
jgi:hypothetical protein